MDRFDVFPKTLGDFTERTLGGGAISLLCMLAACVLFMTEWASFRSMRTVDRLVVDTSADGSGRMLLNVDIYLPSLPCGEFVMDVTDDSGLQQLQVTRTLHKLRMDRHGVPIDIPQAVNWNETVAPAFQQRKVRPPGRPPPGAPPPRFRCSAASGPSLCMPLLQTGKTLAGRAARKTRALPPRRWADRVSDGGCAEPAAGDAVSLLPRRRPHPRHASGRVGAAPAGAG
jgi:hypothetical protein